MADKKQRLVYGILEFLQASMDDGTIKQDDKEGIEVAIQCIGEAFDVDMSNEQQKAQLSVKPANLLQIFDVYLKTQAKRGDAAPRASSSTSASTSAPQSTQAKPASEADKAAAEKLKTEGNSLMAGKKFAEAIAKYTEAIAKNPTNPVYYSNRAAAHSQAGDHQKAVDDAEKAKEIDPSFAKAYSRLGHAYFCMGKYSEAVEAYEKGVELDPTNGAMKSSLATAKAKLADGESDDYDASDRSSVTSPPPSSGAGAGNPFAGLGGGAGGMPDFASLMNNPQMMAMAQQMMQGGGLERLMSNPNIRQMAERFQSGGGMPNMNDIGAMMNDPAVRDLANQFGRGMGRGAGGSGSGSGNNPDMYS